MYLPVTPVKSKHRKSLNLLDVPHPQHVPQAKQHKVDRAYPSTSQLISLMTSVLL